MNVTQMKYAPCYQLLFQETNNNYLHYEKGGYMNAKVRSSVEKSFASLYCFFCIARAFASGARSFLVL